MSQVSQTACESSGTQRGQPDDDAGLIAESRRVPERFGAVFDRHAAAIHGYIARRLGRDAADDLVAETFLVAFRQRGGYDPGQPSARPWLYGIATRLISRRRRDEVRFFRAIARTGVDPAADPVAEPVADVGIRRADAHTLHRQLAGALAGLAATDRDALLLSRTGSLTPKRHRRWACPPERCRPAWPGPDANSARGSAACTPPTRVRSRTWTR
jgi:RNA polymerase sigma-70 factor (ECF subfamily)